MISASVVAIAGALVAVVGAQFSDARPVTRRRRFLEFWWALVASFSAIALPVLELAGLNFGASDFAAVAKYSPLVALGFLVAARNLRQGAAVTMAAWFLVFLFGILFADAVAYPSLMVLLSAALFLPAIISPAAGYSFEALRAGAVRGFALGLGTVAASVLIAPQVLGQCRADKCSVWGVALGPAGTGNALGMALATSAVLAALGLARLRNVVLVLAGAWVLVDLTSSRSAMNTFLLGVLLVGAYRASVRYRTSWPVVVPVLAISGIVVVFPFVDWDMAAFTNRGALWIHALELVSASPWFGYGSSFWVRSPAVWGIELNYSTHNLATELLVSAGWVGGVALAIAFVLAARARGQATVALHGTAILGLVIGGSITEVLSMPGRTYLVPGLVVYLFLVGASRPSEAGDRGLDKGRPASSASLRVGRGSSRRRVAPRRLPKDVVAGSPDMTWGSGRGRGLSGAFAIEGLRSQQDRRLAPPVDRAVSPV